MDGRSLGPASTAGTRLHQSLRGSADQEPSLSLGITSRLAGIRGGPQGAVSDVGDPTERLTSLTALRLATYATLYGSSSQTDSTQGVSPDVIDSNTWVASPPSRLRTSGRIVLRGLGPRPEPEPAGGRGTSDAGSCRAVGPRPWLPPAAFLGAFTAGCCRAARAAGSWAVARSRLVRLIFSSML